MKVLFKVCDSQVLDYSAAYLPFFDSRTFYLSFHDADNRARRRCATHRRLSIDGSSRNKRREEIVVSD